MALRMFSVQAKLQIPKRGFVDVASNVCKDRAELEFVMAAPKVAELLTNIDPVVCFDLVQVDYFVKFGPNNLGFALLSLFNGAKKAQAPDAHGELREIPNIIFVRGGSVAVLVVLKLPKLSYVVTVNQWKLPSGRRLDELVAGMVDEKSGNLVGVAANELKEETGIVLAADRLVQLGEPIYPSPGGCDELITLFACEVTDMTDEQVSNLLLSQHGEEDANEFIKCKATPAKKFASFADQSRDPKMIIAWQRYCEMFHVFP